MRAIVLAAAFASAAATAGTQSYQCVPEKWQGLTAKGLSSAGAGLKAPGPFSVSRIDGSVIGHPGENGTATDHEVLTAGDAKTAFRVISRWRAPAYPFPTAEYLHVQEYADGGQKPFVMVTTLRQVVSGHCT